MIDQPIAGTLSDADQVDALIRNARHSLSVVRSTVVDHLSSPNDLHAKVAILQDLDSVDDSLRRALL
jgi:hypothetical protein